MYMESTCSLTFLFLLLSFKLVSLSLSRISFYSKTTQTSLFFNPIKYILTSFTTLCSTIINSTFFVQTFNFLIFAGPHIVVVPKSTLQNWMNEYARWYPSCRTLSFWGNKAAIKQMIETRFIAGQTEQERDWDVIVTTYEMCITNR